ncbi:MAG: malolactic enzyme [Liquorilactobacillus hordei]|uniref:Malolactic enzyme n=1 Tax=Liquorilactobacillus hordei DSM 19519 TaxID=1423759 RepID=A0A0R1MFR4_9LACO|nr:malolactic enzyme [Liquorilactobacillus hordei]KRL06967.1 malate dehydrogenase [Liquorilactobacillus hordei DSM 19519]MBZ2406372.1 NAD-dependent malic enzyme [Liquorilactobacillus hordei]QYH51672.1 NAD-dependent malic enzyme [Liquorilactobacillus hordei DSM 19519]
MGMNILNDPFKNKGTAFTLEERKELGLEGLLPPYVQTLDQQVAQTYAQYQTKPTDLEKRLFLMQIFNENHVLFYKLFSEHVVEFMPIVYDPTIADTIENYSELFVQSQNATFLSIDNQDAIENSLKNAANGRNIRLIVVTDAEGILGIGDWGTNGVDIAVGKLMVYTAAAGIDPSQVLPVVLDAGTNNDKLLQDSLYLGNHHSRITGDKYYEFVDKFVSAAERLFPNLYLHFEDFGRDNAANLLNKYKDKITTFNDDIQGTGIITLAGILGALNISKQKMTDQIYLCFGAGTAGAGITKRICDEFVQEGLSEEEARKHFYMVDKQGLLFDDDSTLTPEQKPFARSRSEFANAAELTNLLAVVKAVHPTILVGTSTQPGAFTEEVIREMAAHTERPVIFPLSNPTKLAEAKAHDLIEWTEGRALVATGIPAPDVEFNGVSYHIGQANNALVYPGLGLGVIASTATILNDEMISAAAHSLGGIVDPKEAGAAVLPPVSKLDHFSTTVALAVAESAKVQGLTREKITDVASAIDDAKWAPKY